MHKHRPLAWIVALVLALSIGTPGCKKKDADLTPTAPAEQAAETTTPEPEPDPTPPPAREVEDDDFRSEPIEQEEPTRDELAGQLQAQLKTVYFEFDKSDLSDVTRRVLQDNARILKLNPGLDVVVEGHCDDRGTIEYNLALGQRRAASVREYLVSLGVAGNRLRTVSYGEEKPVANGSNESSWSRNRRGEFTVE